MPPSFPMHRSHRPVQRRPFKIFYNPDCTAIRPVEAFWVLHSVSQHKSQTRNYCKHNWPIIHSGDRNRPMKFLASSKKHPLKSSANGTAAWRHRWKMKKMKSPLQPLRHRSMYKRVRKMQPKIVNSPPSPWFTSRTNRKMFCWNNCCNRLATPHQHRHPYRRCHDRWPRWEHQASVWSARSKHNWRGQSFCPFPPLQTPSNPNQTLLLQVKLLFYWFFNVARLFFNGFLRNKFLFFFWPETAKTSLKSNNNNNFFQTN